MKTAPDTPETTCCTVSNMDTFRVESRDGFGKVLIANTLLPKGEIVFSNAPFSWLLRGDYSGSRCGTCFKTPKSSNLLLCAKCKSIQYCSATCQRADWSQHKSECSKMPVIRSLKMSSNCVDDVLLLNRTLVVQKKSMQQCEKHIHPYLGRHITSCGSDHLSSMSIGGGDRTDEMVAVIAATCRVFGHTVPAVAQLMAQFRSNNFGVLSDLMGCIGVGVYPEAALLNHSCAPTCLLTYTLTQDGPIANIVALRDIQPGEELTHSYTDCSLPTTVRKETLRSTYGFTCTCQRCSISANSEEGATGIEASPYSCAVQQIRDIASKFEDTKSLSNETSGGPIGERRPLPLQIRAILDGMKSSEGGIQDAVESSEVDRLITEVVVDASDYEAASAIAVSLLNVAHQLALFDEEDGVSEQWIGALQRLRTEAESLVQKTSSKIIDITSRYASSSFLSAANAVSSASAENAPVPAEHGGTTACSAPFSARSQSPSELSMILLREVVKLLSLVSGPFHVDLYRARGKLMTASLISGDLEGALLQCNYVVAYLCVALSHIPAHPLLGLQLFSLGDLISSSSSAQRETDSLEVYQWCYSILRYSHSSESDIIRNLKKFLKID